MTKFIKGKDGKFKGSIGDGKANVPTAAPTIPGAQQRAALDAAMKHPALRSDSLGELMDGSRAVAAARREYLSARLEATEARCNALAAKRGIAPVTEEEKQEILATAELLYGADPRTTPQAVDFAYGQAVLAVLSGSGKRFKKTGFKGVIANLLLKGLEPKIAQLKIDDAYEQEQRAKARAAAEADYQAIRDFNVRWRSGGQRDRPN